jgi:hypothetical protein
MSEKDMTDLLLRVKNNLRVTKIVATRSVKGRGGDHFAGFAACYDSVQDEPAGSGKDLVGSVSDAGLAPNGMSLREARVAHYLVAMQADIAAHEAALANGGISAQHCSDACKAIRGNYGKLIRRALNGNGEVPADEAVGK